MNPVRKGPKFILEISLEEGGVFESQLSYAPSGESRCLSCMKK